MKKFILILLLSIVSLTGFCQADYTEKSLTDTIKYSKSDTLVAEAYAKLVELLYEKYPDTILPLSQKALIFIEKKIPTATEKEKISLLRSKANALNNIGFVFDNNGQITKALEYYFNALKIQEKINDKEGLNSTYNNIGYIYNQLKDFDKAEIYYAKSLKLKIETKDSIGMAIVYNNLAGNFIDKIDYEKATAYYKKSLKLNTTINRTIGIATAANNIGYLYNNQNNTDSSLKYLNLSLNLYKQINYTEGIGSVHNNIAIAYFKQKQYSKSLYHANIAFDIANQINYIESIIDAAKIRESNFMALNQWKEAHKMSTLYNKLEDSLFNEETRKSSIQKELNYEYEKKEAIKEIEHQKKMVVANAEKEKQKIISILVTIGLVIFGILSLVIYNRLRITKKQKEVIQVQQVEILEKNEELNQQNEEIMAISEKIEEQNSQLKKQNDDILSSINYAKKIQETILPSADKIKSILPNSFVLYLPKDIVSGDFYWMERIGNLSYFAVVDCTGHGVPGAFMSIIGSNGLNKIILQDQIKKPSDILTKLTEYVIKSMNATNLDDNTIKDGMDIALCCLNTDTLELQYAGAYNPLYIVRKNELIQVSATKRPIGHFKRKNMPDFENNIVQLEKEDFVYIFSDGYADQFSFASNKKFTYQQLREKLIEINAFSPDEQHEALLQTHLYWRGKEHQLDDVCLIGVKV